MTSSPTDPRFRILNPAFQVNVDFPNFRRLPPEIRRKIWETAITRERLLQITLQGAVGGYVSFWEERWAISKLFLVNSESRHTALGFYRVHLPCVYRYGDRTETAVLYLNPELDILMVDNDRHFAQFAYDVWANDRCRVGLVNLAMTVSVEWTTFPTPTLPLLQQVLSRLEKVIFVFEGGDRMMYLDRHYARSINLPWQDLPWQLYYSGPIMTRVPSFDRVPQDPRSIKRYLRKISLSSHDPLIVFETWLNHLQDFGVDHGDEVEYQFAVSYMRCRPEIIDRADALGWVKGEAEQQTATLQRKYKRHENPEMAVGEELASYTIPVFGFWLFPIGALGTPWYDPPHERRRIHRVRNRRTPLSKYMPQLCLSYLPG